MSWLLRLKNALRPSRLDADLEDEIADHIERRAAQLTDRGLRADQAQRQARVRFGNPTRMREESRTVRLWASLEGTLQDIRYAWRGMRKAPVFAMTAVVSLALAIGANTAIYSIVDAAILRPLPVNRPDQLFQLTSPAIADPGMPAGEERDSFSYPEFTEYSAITKGIARLGLFSYPRQVEAQPFKAGAPIERLNLAFVSGEAFDMLGVGPAIGRLFSADDDRLPPGWPTVVLGYEYWQRRFQSDSSVIGRYLKLGDKNYEILGVTRKGFFGVEPGQFIDVWVPGTQYDSGALTNADWHWFRILGRFAPSTSPAQLQARLQPAFHRFQAELVKAYRTIPPAIKKQFLESEIRVCRAPSGASQFRQTFSRPLWIVFGVAAGILLIACANVASLLLARSTARAAEMAMRVSLGAGRTRLFRQMLTESLTLSLMAGAAGWILARLMGPLLVRLLSTEANPVRFALAIDTRVLLFCVIVSTVTAVLFGSVPALQASGAQPMSSVRAASGSTGKLRLGKVFLGVQAACAFCLVLVGAAFLFSLANLFRVNPGFDPRGVAVFGIATDAAKKTEETQRQLMFQLQRRVESQQDIQAAALAPWANFGGGGWSNQVVIPGKGPSDREEIFYRVSPGYFATLRTPLLAGRDFEERDSKDSNAGGIAPAIVNEAFARKYFNSLNVVGREFSYPSEKGIMREVIVGLASDALYNNLRSAPDPILYLPITGDADYTMFVRSSLSLGLLSRIVDREARELGAGTRVKEITTLDIIVGNTLLREKLLAGLGGAFAFFGLLLAGIGLFGLLSYSVGRRTREIGIRAALGAQRMELVSLVLTDVGALIGGALCIGLAAGLTVLTVFRSLLFGIQRVDPTVICISAAVFVATAMLAAGLPARRAATIDPISALREE
ncbi:MAG: ABC transporter permease [Bryobacteraceae bacterium]